LRGMLEGSGARRQQQKSPISPIKVPFMTPQKRPTDTFAELSAQELLRQVHSVPEGPCRLVRLALLGFGVWGFRVRVFRIWSFNEAGSLTGEGDSSPEATLLTHQAALCRRKLQESQYALRLLVNFCLYLYQAQVAGVATRAAARIIS
jgi:hypothetical protein